MAKQKQFNLLDVATISGARVSKFDGTKQYVATADLDINKIVGGEQVTYDDRPSRADLIMRRDDILFAKMKKTLKVLAGSPEVEKKIFSTGFYILTPKKNINKKYLYFFLIGSDFNYQKDLYSSGATMAAIGNEGLKRIKIYLPVDSKGNPDIKEQERIVALLEEAEGLKNKRAEADQKMVTVIPALFSKMFGNPLSNPMNWEIKKLGNLCSIRRGASPRPIAKYIGGTVPWIKIGDGTNGDEMYITDTSVKVTEEGAKKSVYLKAGSMVFANCGVSLGFARILKINGCIHDGWLSFENINDSLNEIYLLKFINKITPHLRLIASDGTQPNLTTTIMKNFPIPIPPIKLQNEFAERVNEIFDFGEKQKGSTVSINTLFSSLLSRTFVNN